VTRLLRNLTGLLGFFLLWGVVVQAGLVDTRFVPPPTEVLVRVVTLLGDPVFIGHVVASVLAWAIAMVVAIAIAVPAGLVLGSVRWLRESTRTVIEFLRPIPSVALIPLVLLVVGSGPEAKISLAVYAAVWPILFNTIYALSEIDPVLTETAKSYGTSKTRMLTSVALPHAAPFVFTGIRLSASITLIVVVSVEFLAGANKGLGQYLIEASSNNVRMDIVLAGTVVAGVFGYLINDGLERVGRRLFRWSTVDAEATT
jgi:NitT/TauT family transport system permease protein